MPKHFLNTDRLGVPTISLGRPFQCLNTLSVKKYSLSVRTSDTEFCCCRLNNSLSFFHFFPWEIFFPNSYSFVFASTALNLIRIASHTVKNKKAPKCRHTVFLKTEEVALTRSTYIKTEYRYLKSYISMMGSSWCLVYIPLHHLLLIKMQETFF